MTVTDSAVPGPETLQLPAAPARLEDRLADGRAVAWKEPVAIRTYPAGDPSPYPMFLDHRVYQGSSGKVYPIPFIDSVSDTPTTREWQAVHLENRYLRLMILPELGGRIHVGYDKVTGYDFFYRNNVIKPALVGLAGPWISGGVEFNWPQHHRPATWLPVETTIDHGADGSVTVWCADHDPFTRMSAQHGIRLRPESAVVELVARLHNRTAERQTFLWWANVAARVHDDYQAFFPEDVRYVADHARRALTAYPAADRCYYGVDYPALAAENPGANRIDWYRNVPVPTSYMIVDSQQDFFGGYDHAAGAGMVHWAERRLSPGKKLWTWGNAPFGHAWDAQLTDSDGPYVELMAGVYTDNQPDFAWLLPGETKTFSQYWYPIPGIGPVHQATPDAAVHVDHDGVIQARFAVTSPQPGAQLRILADSGVLAEATQDLAPGIPAVLAAAAADPAGLRVELRDAEGRLLVGWAPTSPEDAEPWVAEEPPAPEEVESVEELYLTGLHLAQYRHPTRSPLAYWDEALARDPGDVRTNLALADHVYRAGDYTGALERVERALVRLTRRNANPTDTEAFYLLGLCLRRLGRLQEAEQAFGKAGWDATWAAAAGFELAQLLAGQHRNRAALRVLDSLSVVGHDSRRTALHAILLRRMGDAAGAETVLRAGLAADPLDATLRLLAGAPLSTDGGLLLDIAADLTKAGATGVALGILQGAATVTPTIAGNVAPMARYLSAALLDRLGRHQEAAAQRAHARETDLALAFPRGLDHHDALTAALQADPDDPVAHYLLGTLLYSHGRRDEAHRHWERAIELGMRYPVLLRNAALAAYNVAGDEALAWQHYRDAVEQAPSDARLRYEQDQLAARLGQSAGERLARLEPIEPIVLRRDDLTVEYLGLLLATGQADRAHRILLVRRWGQERLHRAPSPPSGGVLRRPVRRTARGRHREHLVGAEPVQRPPATARRGRSTRYPAGGRIRAGVPGDVPGRTSPPPDIHALPQPDGDGAGGAVPRESAGRGGGVDRLRQDHTGRPDGPGERRHPVHHADRRPDAQRPVPRPGGRLGYRHLEDDRGSARRRGHPERVRGVRELPEPLRRSLHDHGDGIDDGLPHRSARHATARRGGAARAGLATAGAGRANRRPRRGTRGRRGAALRRHDPRVAGERTDGQRRDRRLDERDRPPPRSRGTPGRSAHSPRHRRDRAPDPTARGSDAQRPLPDGGVRLRRRCPGTAGRAA